MKFTAQLEKRAHSFAIWRRFQSHLSEHKRDLVLVFGAGLLGAGLDILRPWTLAWIFDYALAPSQEVEGRFSFGFVIGTGVAAALLIALSRAGLEYFGTVRRALVGHAVTRQLRYRIFAHLTDLSLGFHAKNKSGDLLMRLMGDVPMVRTMLVDSAVVLTSRLVLIVGMLVVMLAEDAQLTLIVFSIVPILLVVVRLLSKRIKVAVQKQRKKEGMLADFLHEAVAGVAVIQALGRGPETVRRFARDNRRSARAGLKATRLAAGMALTVEGLLAVIFVITLAYGSVRVGDGNLSPGTLLVFLSYVRSLLKPIRSAARHSEKMARGTACGERVLEILDAKVQIASKPDAPAAPERPASLVYEDVEYGYEKGAPVLHGFNARFERGDVVGVFGRSGVGKSTMASLAVRLADPQKGAVRMDDVDIRDLELESLRDRFGMCMQETTLFGEAIRENLLLGDPEATDEQLWDALRAAAAAGFVEELPDGLDTVLDTAGGGLSGGQRRRISLARTLLRGAPVLVVDEPFSGLDREAVLHVRESLVRAAQDGIVIVICHEPEHLEVFDRVVFVNEGRAVDTGTHEELVQRCAEYREVLGRVPTGLAS
jgi:ATP-binding cassette subfamily B protein